MVCAMNNSAKCSVLIQLTVALGLCLVSTDGHKNKGQSFTPDLKLISFTNPYLHYLVIPSGWPSRIFNVYWTNWALAFFVLVSCVKLITLSFWVGTCEASWFDSISNRTFDSRFDSYWWSDSKFSNRSRCQSSFVKKRLVVVKFAFKVDFGSKISVQQHCLTRFMTELK